MRDLAPRIFRQRLTIEATCHKEISPREISDYLNGLSVLLKMEKFGSPEVRHHEDFGWCAYMPWTTSGVHMYTWHGDDNFFTIDIYTCKPFLAESAVSYTLECFDINEIVWEGA